MAQARIEVVEADITTLDVDAIVNAANAGNAMDDTPCSAPRRIELR